MSRHNKEYMAGVNHDPRRVFQGLELTVSGPASFFQWLENDARLYNKQKAAPEPERLLESK